MNLIKTNKLLKEQSHEIKRALSESNDPKLAARELYHGLQGAEIACVVFFCCTQYDLEVLSAELEALFGDTPVLGCTTAGEITPLGYHNNTITGFSLPSSQFCVEACLIKDLASFSVGKVKEKIGGLVDLVKSQAIANFKKAKYRWLEGRPEMICYFTIPTFIIRGNFIVTLRS